MECYTILRAVAAPIAIANIDTDMLVPARFLKTVSRSGLGKALFHTQRFTPDGAERPDFILNRSPWRTAAIIIALENFGCGSSREHAPWALLDYGVRCIIAPSFAEIFQGNCFKNGILPITLPAHMIEMLLAETLDPAKASLVVDLEAQVIGTSGGQILRFAVDGPRRDRLLAGTDDIARTLALSDAIETYEQQARHNAPWIRSITPSEI